MKNAFESLEASTARKLDLLCNSMNEKEKYIGKTTDSDRTIRKDYSIIKTIIKTVNNK